MAGETELATEALAELRRTQPNITLAWAAKQLPLQAGESEHFVEGLRRAGLE
jgi:hypothetical protein